MPAAVSGNIFNADNAMTSFNGATLSYDPNGNLISDGTNTYAWDGRNHLTGISGGTAGSFIYDAFGRRVQKTINGTSTQFLYDLWNPVQEIQGGAAANLLTGLGIDEYFQRADSAGARDYLTDILGSTLALTDSSGAIQTSYTYEPFGNTTASGAASTNPFQFTGRENDGTGLYYYRARYYSPTFQRFVAQDPIGFRGGDFNLYGYVLNSPLNGTDPLGQNAGPNLYNYVLNNPITLAGLLEFVTPTPTPTPTPTETEPLSSCEKYALCLCGAGLGCGLACGPDAAWPCIPGCFIIIRTQCRKSFPCGTIRPPFFPPPPPIP